MEIKGKVHCFFEQSGTFKREFIKLGIPAEDYDIQNNFGETDHTDDLFKAIEDAYDGKPSLWDNVTSDDLVMAFSSTSASSRNCATYSDCGSFCSNTMICCFLVVSSFHCCTNVVSPLSKIDRVMTLEELSNKPLWKSSLSYAKAAIEGR